MKGLLLVLVVMGLLLGACGGGDPPAVAQERSAAAQQTEALFKDWADAAQSLDLERMMSHYSDDVAFSSADGGSFRGREDVKQQYGYVMGLSGVELATEDYLVSSDGRWVAAEASLSWMPAKGSPPNMSTGLVILEYRDGKIVREIHLLAPQVVRSGR